MDAAAAAAAAAHSGRKGLCTFRRCSIRSAQSWMEQMPTHTFLLSTPHVIIASYARKHPLQIAPFLCEIWPRLLSCPSQQQAF